VPGGVILLTKCEPADMVSAPAADRLDHMIGRPCLRSQEPITLGLDRCSTRMLRQTPTGVKLHQEKNGFAKGSWNFVTLRVAVSLTARFPRSMCCRNANAVRAPQQRSCTCITFHDLEKPSGTRDQDARGSAGDTAGRRCRHPPFAFCKVATRRGSRRSALAWYRLGSPPMRCKIPEPARKLSGQFCSFWSSKIRTAIASRPRN
jgi:hypothetical protein